MRRPRFGPLTGVILAAVMMALISLGHIARPLAWAEGCGRELHTAPTSADGGPEFVDPWALSPTGEHLGPGFGLEDEGLPLLP